MMRRKAPPAPSLKRRIAYLEPKVEVVIACEGRNTEPRYFDACIRAYGAGMVRLRVLPDTGAPITVVKAAIAEREDLVARARRMNVTDRGSFRVWAIFDKDDYDVVEALDVARRNHIDVAFSNPCFELWPLLHLRDYGAQDGRHELQRLLRILMPKYDHANTAEIDFDLIRGSVTTAMRRAEVLEKARIDEGCPLGAPSTTAHLLVKKILENGNISARREAANL